MRKPQKLQQPKDTEHDEAILLRDRLAQGTRPGELVPVSQRELRLCQKYPWIVQDASKMAKALHPATHTPAQPREVALNTAREAVMGSRQLNYGSPEQNFKRIMRLWNSHLLNRFEREGGPYTATEVRHGTHVPQLTEADVAMMLSLVKTGRLANDMTHADSWFDMVGYAACGYEVSRPQTATEVRAKHRNEEKS